MVSMGIFLLLVGETMKAHIVGAGNMGKRYEKILIDRGYEVTCSDIDSSKADKDINPNADCYLVCTPPEEHVKVSIPLLATGKRVMIEKPIATTMKGAELLRDFKDQIYCVNNYEDWDLSHLRGKEATLYYYNIYPNHIKPHYLDLIHYVMLFKKYGVKGSIEMNFNKIPRSVYIISDSEVFQEPFPYETCLERNIDNFIVGAKNYDLAVDSLRTILHPKGVGICVM